MTAKKSFSNLNYFLVITGFFTFFSCGVKNDGQSQSIHLKELKLTLLDSTQHSVSFSGKTHIGSVPYEIINTVKYNEVGEHFSLIHRKDTLKIYLDPSFLKDSLYDVNKDQRADLNFIFQGTKGYVIYSFPYLKNKGCFRNVPDSIYRNNL
jgi:hypothetical protein